MTPADVLKAIAGAFVGGIIAWAGTSLTLVGDVAAQRASLAEFRLEVRSELGRMTAIMGQIANRVDSRLDYTPGGDAARR